MYSMEWEYHTTDRFSFQYFLYGLLFHQGKYFIKTKFDQNSESWAFLKSRCNKTFFFFFSVHCCKWQILVYARTIFICRLFHHTSIICIHIPWQNMDRFEVFKSTQTYDSTRYFAIPQYSQNLHLNQIGTTHLHFYICMVNCSWNYSFGKTFSKIYNAGCSNV